MNWIDRIYKVLVTTCLDSSAESSGAEEEEEFYKLRLYSLQRVEEEEEEFRPANKTDHLCQSWQYCHMFRQSIT